MLVMLAFALVALVMAGVQLARMRGHQIVGYTQSEQR